ncbi:MAG TPA: VanW family protein [Micromonosporaceae bacterium]
MSSLPPPTQVSQRPRQRRRLRTVLLAGLAGLVVLGLVAGGIVAAVTRHDVPAGTRVLGIDIGGRSADAARRSLLTGLADRLNEPVPVRVGGTPATIDPVGVGLQLDAAATVAAASSGWPNPFAALTGHDRSVDPVVTVDTGRLDRVLAERIGSTGRAAKPASVTYQGLRPQASYATAGEGLDQPGAAAALRAGWLRAEQITLPLTTKPVQTPSHAVDDLISTLARPAVAAPVTVTVAGQKFTVTPAAIANSLVMVAGPDGTITPRVDQARLRTALAGQLAQIEEEPHQAAVPMAGGEQIVANSGGTRLDTAALSRDLLAVLAKPAPRSVPARLVPATPTTTAAELARQGIVERVATFTTSFDSAGQARNTNIIQVAKEVDGAIVRPGATFSLNGYTGPRGYAEGYVDAPVISGGKLVNAVGGGISQFTTTLFNAMYYAGLEDVFHQPHSYYFSRYPSVIESTIFYPSLDMKFRNDAPTSVLIDTATTDHSVTVTMWGTKRYDIATVWGPRTGVTAPQTVHLAKEPGCIATKGIDGFTQNAWRVFKQDGREVKRERFTHTYKAEPRFVCDR